MPNARVGIKARDIQLLRSPSDRIYVFEPVLILRIRNPVCYDSRQFAAICGAQRILLQQTRPEKDGTWFAIIGQHATNFGNHNFGVDGYG
jgi:hypothetical protein